MEYVVIGLGRFGQAVAKELENLGHEVIGIDQDANICRLMSDEITQTLILNSTDEKAIKEASIDHVDTAIIGIGADSLTDSLLTAMVLKKLGVKQIIAKASNEDHQLILEKIGVDKVVRPEHQMGVRTARKLQGTALLDYIDISDDIRLDGITVNESNDDLVDKSIIEINLRKKYNINIICIKRNEELIIPESETIVKANDTILVVGKVNKVDKFERELKN